MPRIDLDLQVTRPRDWLKPFLLPAVMVPVFLAWWLLGRAGLEAGPWVVIAGLATVVGSLTIVGGYPMLAPAAAAARDPGRPAFARPKLAIVGMVGALLGASFPLVIIGKQAFAIPVDPEAAVWLCAVAVAEVLLLATIVDRFPSNVRPEPRPKRMTERRMSAALQAAADEGGREPVVSRASLPSGRMSVTGPEPRAVLRPAPFDFRTSLRRLVWRHIGWTVLVVGSILAVNQLVVGAIMTSRPPPLEAYLLPGAFLAYAAALFWVTRGPKAQVSETSRWLQMLVLWRPGRSGYPLLFIVVLLTFGAFAILRAAQG